MSCAVLPQNWKGQENECIQKLKLSLPNIKLRNSDYLSLLVKCCNCCLHILLLSLFVFIDFAVEYFVAFYAYCALILLCIWMQMCLWEVNLYYRECFSMFLFFFFFPKQLYIWNPSCCPKDLCSTLGQVTRLYLLNEHTSLHVNNLLV